MPGTIQTTPQPDSLIWRTLSLVIECKRTLHSSWIFLMPASKDMARRHVKAWMTCSGGTIPTGRFATTRAVRFRKRLSTRNTDFDPERGEQPHELVLAKNTRFGPAPIPWTVFRLLRLIFWVFAYLLKSYPAGGLTPQAGEALAA